MDKITCDSVEFVLEELSLHDPKAWDVWAPLLVAHAQKLLDYVPRHAVSRDVYLEKVMHQGYVW